MMLKVTWKRLIVTGLALSVLGMGVAWSGVINIGASTGHWPITSWLLHWAMRNTVRTQSALTVDRPAIDPSGLVSAAGHYAATCASCHGAPGQRRSPVMGATTPDAPDLARTARSWSDEQLFWIIKHGVKFTPMPAWPDQDRDDEIRRMAAFVRRLPEMSPERYRALAYGPGESIVGGEAFTLEVALPDCARCHGDDGRGRGQPDIPVLAGQNSAYLAASLRAYASARRSGGVMGAAAARVDPSTTNALVAHYSSLPGLSNQAEPAPAASGSSEDLMAASIVARGLREANLPACSSCHSPGKRPGHPVLAGQKAQYMIGRLHRWRGDPTVIDARKPNAPMPVIARRIPESMIEPLARYFERQGLEPEPRAEGPAR